MIWSHRRRPLSEHWIQTLGKLTVEQCEQLIGEVGPVAPLTREFKAKSLMRLFPGLNRDLALLLVSATKETRGATNDPIADQFAQVLVKCRSTSRELNDAMVFCQDSPYGLKCFRTAVGYYLKDPVAKGHRDLRRLWKTQTIHGPIGL